MQFARFGDRYQVRLESGEEVQATLVSWLASQAIGYAAVSGLGAVREITLSYWNADTLQYETHAREEQMEVVSLVGNVTLKDDAPFLHLHVALGRRDLSLIGGHFNDAIAHPTLEIWLQPESEPVRRVPDMASGLSLIDLPRWEGGDPPD